MVDTGSAVMKGNATMSETRMLASGYKPPRYEGAKEYRIAARSDVTALPSHVAVFGVDGAVREAKVNGATKLWKRSPQRFSVPLKYGMYEYWRADEDTQAGWNPGAILIEVS